MSALFFPRVVNGGQSITRKAARVKNGLNFPNMIGLR